MVKGMNYTKSDNSVIICEPCVAAKQTRNPFKLREERRSNRVLELIHSDVCGPVTPTGWNGQRYFVSFIDDWSRFTVVYLIHSKNEVVDCFKFYEAQMTAKFERKISRLASDNGGEYTCREMRSFCKDKGIKQEFTVPFSPEQNGLSERMNRTIVEKARSLLIDSGISRFFWGEAVQTVSFLINRSPAAALGVEKTPAEIWNGRKPDVSWLRVFGSIAYCHIPKEKRKKLDEKCWKGIFVGYGTNGYRVWNPVQRKIMIVRGVIFDETPKPNVSEISCEDKQEANHGVKMLNLQSEETKDEALVQQQEDNEEVEHFESFVEENPVSEESDDAEEFVSTKRVRQPPVWLSDYDTTFAGFALSAIEYVSDLPSNIQDMKQRSDWPNWETAIQEELDALKKNNTWTLTELPKGRRAISCKWVFRMKPENGREMFRYKARLVAKGYCQRYGFDYTETYSPVAKMDTLRVLLAAANQERMLIHQLDVKTAFLNGRLNEEIYMCQPEGLEYQNGLVCRLNKSLYGLKQASKMWNERFHSFLTQLSFKRTESDQCLYMRGNGQGKVFLILYVDDVLIVGHSLEEITALKASLFQEFTMTDGGEVSNFLGMKIERNINDRILRISQQRYLEDLLKRFNMYDCKPSSVPMEPRLNLEKGQENDRTSKP